jgi:hypothetical protein
MYFGNSVLVGGGISELGLGKTDAGVGGIKYRIEPLEECVAVDEVKSLATRRANVVNDEIYGATTTTKIGVERTRPDLGVWGETVGFLCKMVNKGCED